MSGLHTWQTLPCFNEQMADFEKELAAIAEEMDAEPPELDAALAAIPDSGAGLVLRHSQKFGLDVAAFHGKLVVWRPALPEN